VIGWLAGVILGKEIPGGVFGNIIAGLIGSAIGSKLLGMWGANNRRRSYITSFNWSHNINFNSIIYIESN